MEPEVWYSPADEGYLARCSDQPGIMGFGPTAYQAVMELGVARQAAIEASKDQDAIKEARAKLMAWLEAEVGPMTEEALLASKVFSEG